MFSVGRIVSMPSRVLRETVLCFKIYYMSTYNVGEEICIFFPLLRVPLSLCIRFLDYMYKWKRLSTIFTTDCFGFHQRMILFRTFSWTSCCLICAYLRVKICFLAPLTFLLVYAESSLHFLVIGLDMACCQLSSDISIKCMNSQAYFQVAEE